MKKIHLVIVESANGKCYARSVSIRTGENLKAHLERFPHMCIAHICESATQAHYLAASWNENYQANGSYMYMEVTA